MTPISVLLADDHVLIRAGIRAVVEKTPWIRVIAEAKDERQARELAGSLGRWMS